MVFKKSFVLRDNNEVRLVHSGCIYFHIFIIIDDKISFYHIYHLYRVLFICIIAHAELYKCCNGFQTLFITACSTFCLTLYRAGNFFFIIYKLIPLRDYKVCWKAFILIVCTIFSILYNVWERFKLQYLFCFHVDLWLIPKQ